MLDTSRAVCPEWH